MDKKNEVVVSMIFWWSIMKGACSWSKDSMEYMRKKISNEAYLRIAWQDVDFVCEQLSMEIEGILEGSMYLRNLGLDTSWTLGQCKASIGCRFEGKTIVREWVKCNVEFVSLGNIIKGWSFS